MPFLNVTFLIRKFKTLHDIVCIVGSPSHPIEVLGYDTEWRGLSQVTGQLIFFKACPLYMFRHVTHNYTINFVEGLFPLASEAHCR